MFETLLQFLKFTFTFHCESKKKKEKKIKDFYLHLFLQNVRIKILFIKLLQIEFTQRKIVSYPRNKQALFL